jgi:uncharacterized protein (TIGR02996 family)
VSDGDALLKAIEANPWDDTAWLVYADWLQENGKGEAAAVVREMVTTDYRNLMADARGYFESGPRPGTALRPPTPEEGREFADRLTRRAVAVASGTRSLRSVMRYVAAGDYEPGGEAYNRALGTPEGQVDLMEVVYSLPAAAGRLLLDRSQRLIALALATSDGRNEGPLRAALGLPPA